MESKISEFWYNKEQNMFNNISDLITNIENAYTTDFIDNYNLWSMHLTEINKSMKKMFISYNVNAQDSDWVNMKYDEFCKNIIDSIKEIIYDKKDISTDDITPILDNMLSSYFNNLNKNYNFKKHTITNLLKTINKIKI